MWYIFIGDRVTVIIRTDYYRTHVKTFEREATMEYIHSLMSEYEKFMASDMDWDTFNYKKLSKLDSLVSYGRSDLDHARCQYIQD